MEKISFFIDEQLVTAQKNDSIWQAAQKAGISIPRLCNKGNSRTSCMLCLVKNQITGKYIPSCSAPAENGMKITTKGTDIDKRRRLSLEWLLEEHRGECLAPCTLSCPAHPDIPRIQRLLLSGHKYEALKVFLQSIPLPGVMGLICSAPCEKGCRRTRIDKGLRIKEMEYSLSQLDLLQKHVKPDTTTKGAEILVIGSGPAGIAASWFLSHQVMKVHIIERSDKIGENLRKALDPFRQGEQILQRDLQRIMDRGITLDLNTQWGKEIKTEEANKKFKAIVFAPGKGFTPEMTKGLEIPYTITNTSGQTKRMAIHAIQQGRLAAMELLDQLDKGNRVIKMNQDRRRISSFGKLDKAEYQALLHLAKPKKDETGSLDKQTNGLTWNKNEARRCLLCGCDKDQSCDLKKRALEFNLKNSSKSFRLFKRKKISQELIFEQGKCIKCGRCIDIIRAGKYDQGPAFLERGSSMEIDFIFSKTEASLPEKYENQLAQSCPTGALFLLNPHKYQNKDKE